MSKEKGNIKLVPELRFSEFEKGDSEESYVTYLFTDIFIFSTGKNIKQREASPEFKIPCVRYGELYHMYNEVIYEVINKTNLNRSELRFSKGNEILLPSAGEDPMDIGSASALTIENVAIGRTINILSPLEENVYSQIYVSYYINEKFRRKISTLAKGSSISNVYNSDLKKLSLLLPSLPEQQKIAATLTSLDQLIAAQNEKLEALQAYKKGLLQQLFPAKGEKVPKLRFGEFEEDWEEQMLQDVCEINPSNHFLPKEFVYIDLESVESGKLLKKRKISLETAPSRAQRLLTNGDTIFQMVRPYQRNNYFFNSTDDLHYVASTGYAQLRAFQSKRYLFQYIHSDDFVDRVLAKCTGSNYPAINSRSLAQVTVLIPKKIEEQQKIASCLSSLDDLITHQFEKIKGLKEHKKGMMQQLFPNSNPRK